MYLIRDQQIKAVVITPPIEDFYATPHRISSLGAAVVTELLEREHVETHFIEGMHPDDGSIQVPLPDALSYLKPHLLRNETGKCSFFSQYRRFGRPLDDITAEVREVDPHLCFISCFAYCYSATTIKLAKIIRQALPEVTIITGGAGTSVNPQHFLRNNAIDFTLSGEAELFIPPFIDFCKRGFTHPDLVPSLGWKEESRLFFTSAGEHTTSSTMLPVIKQTSINRKYISFTASLSRGCFSRCSFCANHLAHGNQFRHCTIDQFGRLLDSLPVPAGSMVHFNFEDDNLLCDIPFFTAVIAACRSRFPDVKFTAENGIDYRLMTTDTCNTLIDSGFRQFNFTIGSVTPDILEQNNRISGFDHYDRLLHCASSRSIPVISYIICGFPGDTPYSIAANLKFLLPRPTLIGMSLFYPVPGIQGFQDLTKFDNINPVVCCGSSAYPWSSMLSSETLVTAFRCARLINLLKNEIHTEEEKNLISTTMRTCCLHTVVKDSSKRKIIRVPHQDEVLVKNVFFN